MPSAMAVPEIRQNNGLSDARYRALQESFKDCAAIDKTVNLTSERSRD